MASNPPPSAPAPPHTGPPEPAAPPANTHSIDPHSRAERAKNSVHFVHDSDDSDVETVDLTVNSPQDKEKTAAQAASLTGKGPAPTGGSDSPLLVYAVNSAGRRPSQPASGGPSITEAEKRKKCADAAARRRVAKRSLDEGDEVVCTGEVGEVVCTGEVEVPDVLEVELTKEERKKMEQRVKRRKTDIEEVNDQINEDLEAGGAAVVAAFFKGKPIPLAVCKICRESKAHAENSACECAPARDMCEDCMARMIGTGSCYYCRKCFAE